MFAHRNQEFYFCGFNNFDITLFGLFLNFAKIYLPYMYEFPPHVCVCIMCMPGAYEPRRRHWIPWKGPFEGRTMLLTARLSLHPLLLPTNFFFILKSVWVSVCMHVRACVRVCRCVCVGVKVRRQLLESVLSCHGFWGLDLGQILLSA